MIYFSSCKASGLLSASAYHPSCRGPDSSDFQNLPQRSPCFSSSKHIRLSPRGTKVAEEDGTALSPPSQRPPHLSSAAGTRSSARPAGTCEWRCRPESASPGSCTAPRSPRCICHPRSARGAGSRGGRRKPLQERDAPLQSRGNCPGCSFEGRCSSYTAKHIAFEVAARALGSFNPIVCPGGHQTLAGSCHGASVAQQTLHRSPFAGHELVLKKLPRVCA